MWVGEKHLYDVNLPSTEINSYYRTAGRDWMVAEEKWKSVRDRADSSRGPLVVRLIKIDANVCFFLIKSLFGMDM